MVFEWFECKVKYDKTAEEGALKKVTEPYLVSAVNFTEAEKRITEEMTPYISGEFQVSDIKRAKFAELFRDEQDSADKWYKCKLSFITLDEKSGKEKRSSQILLVQAATVHGAIKRVDEEMGKTMIDYVITAVDETPLMDVFFYEETAPEGMALINKREKV